jgi:predicted nucleic acid-binding protein
MLFIYWIEKNPSYTSRMEELHKQILLRKDTLCTSTFTVGEILTGFYKRGAYEIAYRIRETLRPPLVDLIPFTGETADHYSRIRAAHSVSPADAIHLASAAQAKANLFLTNDRRLSKLVVPGIDFIAGPDVNLL